uniref:Histone deacetylase n=1 Tax=Neolamprologus brichardi TaxID=32507 RepID=A0A3Q4NBV2_NEOBR
MTSPSCFHPDSLTGRSGSPGESPGGGGGGGPVDLRTEPRVGSVSGGAVVDTAMREQQLQQELILLKQQQELQKQLLFAEFQKKHEVLTRQHEVQLQEHLKQQQELLAAKRQQELEQKRKLEQQRHEEQEKQRLEQQLLLLRNKEKGKESAIASTEVKLKLQEFLLSKKEPGSGGLNHSFSPKSYKGRPQHSKTDKSAAAGLREAHRDVWQDLRTASPNLKVRSRLKQKVAERRSSPLLRRKDGTVISTFKKRAIEISVSSLCNSAPGSGPSSPNSSNTAIANGNTGSVPNIQTEVHTLGADGTLSPLSLYTSPSLPNISLGLPANTHITVSHCGACTHRHKNTQTHTIHRWTRHTHCYTTPPPSSHSAHSSLLQHVLLLEQARQQTAMLVPMYSQSPLVTAERGVSGGMRAVNKLPRHRPLARTQSAPLPQSPQALQQLVVQQQHHHFLEKHYKMLSKGTDLPRPPPTHPEETEEELTETNDMQEEDEGVGLHRCASISVFVCLCVTHSFYCIAISVCIFSSPSPGLVYDSLMLKHQCVCGNAHIHPEHAGRVQSIWSRLQETGLLGRCERIRGRKASLDEIQSVHSEFHTLLYGTSPLNRHKLDHKKLLGTRLSMYAVLPCGGIGVDSDTVWNEMHSSAAVRMAVGSVIELAFRVAAGELKNGFAVVRPPGHHAEESTAMGFCFFNSVAITAKLLQQKLGVGKILIVDWDIHHGNGTQQAFYSDPNVLYISLHRYDDGNFFPGSGAPEEVITQSHRSFCGCDDSTNQKFQPRLTKVTITPHWSADFLEVSSTYSLVFPSLCLRQCDSMFQWPQEKPCPKAYASLERVIEIQSKHWSCLQSLSQTSGHSLLDGPLGAQGQSEKDEAETVSAMASLSVDVEQPEEPMEEEPVL